MNLKNIYDLSVEQKKDLMRRKFNETSRFQTEFSTEKQEFDCLGYHEKLRAEIIRILELKGVSVPNGDLENLHQTISRYR